jgi:hypothetical protein
LLKQTILGSIRLPQNRKMVYSLYMNTYRILLAALVIILCNAAYAGMPSFTVTDAGKLRLQSVSFFLLGLAVSAFLVQRLWNYLQTDFKGWPRLTYFKALTLVMLWGLVFVIVLTMISGARELLTPGAWRKDGVTYKLQDSGAISDATRQQRLEVLKRALWQYAETHEGKRPPHDFVPEIPSELWESPTGARFIYVAGQTKHSADRPLVYEPKEAGEERFVLLNSGEIRRMSRNAILQAWDSP